MPGDDEYQGGPRTHARPDPLTTAQRLWSRRYASASVLFCGGSVVRGEGFPSSDLDIVAIFPSVMSAWRESLLFEGWPVEVFAHDAETLAYFVAQDCKRGTPSLAQMIAEGLPAPAATDHSRAIQAWAKSLIATGPEAPTNTALANDRYWLTDLVHDFRDDRSPAELRAIACKLYPLINQFVLKSRGRWLGSGKFLPKLVQRTDRALSDSIESAFEAFFTTGERGDVLRLVELILKPFGGELFDGFRSDAPVAFRLKSEKPPWVDGGA